MGMIRSREGSGTEIRGSGTEIRGQIWNWARDWGSGVAWKMRLSMQ